MRSKSEPKPMVACFDLVDTLHFLWSVAQARAVQEETKIVWQPYRDSSVLNGIYWVFRSYGTPGTAEVRQDSKRIEERTERYFNELIDKFLLRAADNSHPLSLGTWMSVQKDIRDYALESVQETFRDAAGINQEVVEGTAKGISRNIGFWEPITARFFILDRIYPPLKAFKLNGMSNVGRVLQHSS